MTQAAGFRFEETVDVNLAIISRPLHSLLEVFHNLSGNWGVAIILLTVFINMLTFYPNQRASLSAKKMQALAPKMAALKKKYGDDRQRMSVETMNLYKTHGVSPLGGCLPMLIQMPVWIALYSTLNYSVEIHRAGFFGYIQDLSIPDPYYITPLFVGAVMFLQMKMAPTGTDPQQQKMMAVIMPVMMTGMTLFLPAGLAVYMLTNSVLRILQQMWTNRTHKKVVAKGQFPGAATDEPSTNRPEQKRQAAQASGSNGAKNVRNAKAGGGKKGKRKAAQGGK